MAAGKYHGAAALRGKIIEQIKQVQQCRLFQTCRYLALIAMNQFDAWGRADEHVAVRLDSSHCLPNTWLANASVSSWVTDPNSVDPY